MEKTASRSIPEFTELAKTEKTRVYEFPDGERVTLSGVQRLAVSNSGAHRLETEDGKKHIVSPGWLHIELEVEEWSL